MATGGDGADARTPATAAAQLGATQVQAPLPGPQIALPTAAAAPEVAMNTTATLPTVSAASSHTSPATSTPAEPPGVLPAWTGLPHPPLWLKEQEQPQDSASKSPTYPDISSFLPGSLAVTGGAGSATTSEVAQQAVEGGGETGAWSGGIGEKRPRLVFLYAF